MEPRLLFLILVGIAIGLSCLAGYWRKKAGEAAFAAALLAIKPRTVTATAVWL